MVLYDDRGNFLVGGQLLLSTRRGRQIPNDRRRERPPAAMSAARELVLSSRPTARVRSLTSIYNCMGMVFATRRTTVLPDELEMILEDDDFRRISFEWELMAGDVVVYRDTTGFVVHVGLVAEIRTNLSDGSREVIVLSQWGADGEYFHRVDDVNPVLGSPAEYWTDRR